MLGGVAFVGVLQCVRKKYCQQAALFFRIITALRAIDDEKKLCPVRSNPHNVAWPEPNVDAQSGEKILWGFWDGGQEAMPVVCQLAVRSWHARNPGWRVVILSDTNYKEFVSLSDLPSTFDSLIPQHRSDILRIAVLLRYGGIYLDVSTFVYRGFDQVWEELDDKSLGLSTAVHIPDTNLQMYNNAMMMSKTPQNAVLLEWQKRVKVYMENPGLTKESVCAHPSFQRILKYIQNDAMGIVLQQVPYCAILFLLADIV